MTRSPFIKRTGPDGKIHEGWCAIFDGDCCSCKDDGRGRGKRIRKDDGGAKVEAPQTKQSEMA